MVAVKRFALEGERMERIAIDAHVSPLEDGKYGRYLTILGPASDQRMRAVDGDMVSIEANVRGGLLMPSVPPHHLFVGIQDTVPAVDLKSKGLIKTLRLLQTTPGYLGGWPKPGFLDMLPLGLGGGPPDAQGYSQLLLGLWRRQFNDYSVLSFDRGLLEYVSPRLGLEPAEQPAQARIRVGDLAHAQLRPWVSSLYYDRALQTSLGNIRLMHLLSQQLGVPQSEAKNLAESLFDSTLACSLGGKYELQRVAGMPLWNSTAFATNAFFNFPGNTDFFLHTAGWLAEERDLISIVPKEPALRPFIPNPTQERALLYIQVLFLPITTMLTGVMVWRKRRRL